jgi:far upstream element-binding protein
VDPDPLVEEQAEIPAMHVGRVIGKGGEMIRDLQARSGARLDVDQNVPVGLPRKITYRGTRSTVDFAKHLVALLCTEGVDENSLPLGKASQEKVVIPSQAVGKVIGRGGEMIRELQTRSHAKIQIDHTGASGVSEGQKQVTITGTFEAVQKGKEMVLFLSANPMMDAQQALNMLIDEKLRTRQPWGTGPPYPDLPNQGMNMQPAQLGYAPYEGGYLQQPPLSYQQPVVYGGPPSYAQRGGPPSFSPTYGVRETEIFYAAKQFMGRIIGGRGVTINDLTRRSGCDIQINQDVPPGQDCEITIKGSREGIESAKQMIQEIIEVGPQHPYAGGAGDYGGAGYQAQAGYQQVQQYPYQYQQLGYGQEVYGQAAYGRVGYVPQDSYSQQYGGGGGGYGGPSYGGGGGYQAPSVPPSDWKTATAPDGQIYYFNERTGETQWDKPAGMS